MSQPRCVQCGKGLDETCFLSLRQYNTTLGVNGTVVAELDFCSSKCLRDYQLASGSKPGLAPYFVLRCPGYMDCKRLDNVRRRCESETPYSETAVPPDQLEAIATNVNWCAPAEVSTIKASLRMMDASDEMLRHTKAMRVLTIGILVFTIANLIILILPQITPLLQKLLKCSP